VSNNLAGALGLSQSAEDYLEAVLVLGQSGRMVRVTDLAERLTVSKPSVVAALASLEEKSLVRHEHYGGVELTAAGKSVAEEVYRRHRLLHEFLRDVLGVPDKIAAQDACRMEHVLSPETVNQLVRLVGFFRTHNADDAILLHELQKCLEKGQCSNVKVKTETGNGKANHGGRMKKLSDLKVGVRAIVKGLKGDHTIRRRLMDMGLVPGVEVKVSKVAPLGDPIDIEVKGYHLSLRKDEAQVVLVEEIE